MFKVKHVEEILKYDICCFPLPKYRGHFLCLSAYIELLKLQYLVKNEVMVIYLVRYDLMYSFLTCNLAFHLSFPIVMAC